MRFILKERVLFMKGLHMISKKVVISFIVTLNFSFCLKGQDKASQLYFDINNNPILEVLSTESRDIKYKYHFQDGKTDYVTNDIEFKQGDKVLGQFCDSIYFAKYFKDIEFNTRLWYVILFDKEIQIKDVRIIKPTHIDICKYECFENLKSIILETNGKWRQNKSSSLKLHIYIGMMRIP